MVREKAFPNECMSSIDTFIMILMNLNLVDLWKVTGVRRHFETFVLLCVFFPGLFF